MSEQTFPYLEWDGRVQLEDSSGILINPATEDTLLSIIKDEDSVHISWDKWVMLLAVRSDGDLPTANDGDYTVLKLDEEWRLKVASKPASYSDITWNITAIQATIGTPVAGGTVAWDVSRSSNIMIFCTWTFAGINCTFEGSIESSGDTNWFAVQAVRSNANTIELVTGVLSAQPAYSWEASVNALKRFRVRATARTSGTQSWRFVQWTYATEPIPASQVSATQPVSGTVTATVWWASLALPTVVTDVASGAIITTTTTSAILPTAWLGLSVSIPVTVVTGTNPTLDVRIEESDDNGINWKTLFNFPRITATGFYRSPTMVLQWNRIRYVQTISWTTPSFTRWINRLQRNIQTDRYRQLIDRAINVNSLSATSLVLDSGWASKIQLVVDMWAITTTAPQFKLQWSDNNLTWYDLDTVALTAVASSSVQKTVINITATFVRAIESVAGSGATIGRDWILIKCYD